MKILVIALIVIAVIICGPIATISSINTLFGLGIEITFGTWLSALWLGMVVGGATYRGSK